MSHHKPSLPKVSIPSIDISKFTPNDPEDPESNLVVDQVRRACETAGFFSLKGHGIPRKLQDDVMQAARDFFALPEPEKARLTHPTIKNRGFERMGAQTLQRGTRPDKKEGFYMSRHFEASSPTAQRHPRLQGTNVFPAEDVLPAKKFREPLEKYYAAVLDLSLKVFEILARGLEHGDHVFDNFVAPDPLCILRLLHYEPQASRDDPLEVGAGAHTDWGAITLLYAESPGLEVLHPDLEGRLPDPGHHNDENVWIPVKPDRDAYVVNIGDMLSSWTRGRYRSNVHRVLNVGGGGDRYSVPFFFDGDLDCPLAPFGGAAPGEQFETAGEHMIRKMDASYKGPAASGDKK